MLPSSTLPVSLSLSIYSCVCVCVCVCVCGCQSLSPSLPRSLLPSLQTLITAYPQRTALDHIVEPPRVNGCWTHACECNRTQNNGIERNGTEEGNVEAKTKAEAKTDKPKNKGCAPSSTICSFASPPSSAFLFFLLPSYLFLPLTTATTE